MKKRLFIIVTTLLVAILALSLCACGSTENSSSSSDGGQGEPQSDIYAQLNALIGKVGYPLTLTGTTTEDGISFASSYTVTENAGTYTVNYSYEKLGTFEIREGEIVPPSGFKVTCTGSMKVRDGKIIEQNGESANISVRALDVRGINLSAAALTNVQSTEGSFTATISDLNSVIGLDVSVTSASINVTYSATAITAINLTYSTAKYRTTINYRFG